MMRSVTAGLGVLTILSVTAALTPPGQAMLGMRPSQPTSSITVIKDPTTEDAPAASAAVAPSGSRAAVHSVPAVERASAAASLPAATRAQSVRLTPIGATPARRAAVRTARPMPERPATTGVARMAPSLGGEMANVAAILLNLPQVLSQAGHRAEMRSVRPNHPASADRWDVTHHPRGKDHRDGDPESQSNH
jgi:hypothetical protein